MTWLRLSDASVVWALEAARIWIIVFGCAAGGWAIGFAMGYRRGIRDGITGDISTGVCEDSDQPSPPDRCNTWTPYGTDAFLTPL